VRSEAAESVLKALRDGSVFLTGGAGVGKSYTTREVIDYYITAGRNVAVLASTGIAAVAIGGQTVHSFFKLGIAKILPELEASTLRPHHKKELTKLIPKLDLVIIDEISMISAGVFEAIEHRLNQFGFLGDLLVVGDFLQLPPVRRADEENRLMFQFKLPEEERERYFGYAYASPAWERCNFQMLELKEVKRTEDETFIRMLHAVRYGEREGGVKAYLHGMVKPLREHDKQSTLLFAVNARVDQYNSHRLADSPHPIEKLQARIELLEPHNEFLDKQVASYINALPVEEILSLRLEAPILFTINTPNYCNGERGVVEKIYEDEERGQIVKVKKSDGNCVEVEPFTFEMMRHEVDDEDEIAHKTVAKITQFPLRLAWAMTIHKSQGMSINKLDIAIDEIFERAQFYVALSRATDPSGVSLLSARPAHQLERWMDRMIMADPNVVAYYRNYRAKPRQRGLF